MTGRGVVWRGVLCGGVGWCVWELWCDVAFGLMCCGASYRVASRRVASYRVVARVAFVAVWCVVSVVWRCGAKCSDASFCVALCVSGVGALRCVATWRGAARLHGCAAVRRRCGDAWLCVARRRGAARGGVARCVVSCCVVFCCVEVCCVLVCCVVLCCVVLCCCVELS